MMIEGLVSVIMPSYNASRFIAKSINSVLLQTYSNWELLIVDDCSKDNSAEIVRKFTDIDKRVKLFLLEKNAGAATARNVALEYAKGQYIAFLDSDDETKLLCFYFFQLLCDGRKWREDGECSPRSCFFNLSSILTKYNYRLPDGNN